MALKRDEPGLTRRWPSFDPHGEASWID